MFGLDSDSAMNDNPGDMDETSDRFSNLESLINRRFDILQTSNEQISDQLRHRSLADAELVRENRDLHKRVKTLEDRLLTLEKQYNNTDQNHRKNNIEIEGIPAYVTDEQLRFIVAELLNHVADSDITVNDLEAVHRLYSKANPKPTIVRLKRNLIDELKSKEAKKKLGQAATRMEFPKGTRIFINDNLSPNMRSLAFNARQLKKDNVIAETWFSNAAVRIKREPNSKPFKVTHEKDLVDAFPNYAGFNFDMDFYRRIQEEEDIDRYDNLSGCWEGFETLQTSDTESVSSTATVVASGSGLALLEVERVRNYIAQLNPVDVGEPSKEGEGTKQPVDTIENATLPPWEHDTSKIKGNPHITRSRTMSSTDLASIKSS